MKRRVKKNLLKYAIKNSFMSKHPQTFSNGRTHLHFAPATNNNSNGRTVPVQDTIPGKCKGPQVARYKAVEREKIVLIKVDPEITFRLATKRKRIEPETVEPTNKRIKLSLRDYQAQFLTNEPKNTRDDVLNKLFDNGSHDILENIFLKMSVKEAVTCRKVSKDWKRLVDFYCGGKFPTIERALARESSRQDGTTGRLPELKLAVENCPLGNFLAMINSSTTPCSLSG